METLIIIIAVAGLATVCGATAFFAAKNKLPGEDINSLRAQLAEDEKTSEDLERNRRFSASLIIAGIG